MVCSKTGYNNIMLYSHKLRPPSLLDGASTRLYTDTIYIYNIKYTLYVCVCVCVSASKVHRNEITYFTDYIINSESSLCAVTIIFFHLKLYCSICYFSINSVDEHAIEIIFFNKYYYATTIRFFLRWITTTPA